MKKLLNLLLSASTPMAAILFFLLTTSAEVSALSSAPPLPANITSFGASTSCDYNPGILEVQVVVTLNATFDGECAVTEVCYEDESGNVTCIDFVAEEIPFGSSNPNYSLFGLASSTQYSFWASTAEDISDIIIINTNACDEEVTGCTDPTAANFDPEATWSTDTCIYPGIDVTLTFLTDCWGGESSWELSTVTGVEIASVSSGTYGNLETYTWTGTVDAGCYIFAVGDTFGDGLAGTQYFSCGVDGDFDLTTADGLVLAQMGEADFGNEVSFVFCVDNPYQPGCTDQDACNYDPANTHEDGSCLYPGCEDPYACNYLEEPGCVVPCDYESCDYICPGDFNGDGIRGTEDLLIMLVLIGSSDPEALIADLDGNAVVGAGDWLLFLGLFGTPCPE